MAVEKTSRLIWLDVCRVIASFAVMIIHISSQFLAEVEAGSHEWVALRAYRDCGGFAVPVFVMISGTLFLSRDLSISVILKKYVRRIALIYVVWSALYVIVLMHSEGPMTMLGNFVSGWFSHLWYLYMVAGLYLVSPILRKIVTDEKLMKYFLALGLAFYVAGCDLIEIITLISRKAGGYFQSAYSSMGVTLCTGLVFYYVLGYFFGSRKLHQGQLTAVYEMGLAVYVLTICSFLFRIRCGSVYLGDVLTELEAVRVLKAVFVFTLIGQICQRIPDRAAGIIGEMGRLSLGAFLIHQLVITLLNRWFGLNTRSFETAVSVPVIGVLVFLLSYGLIRLIRFIPFVKKYLT